MEILASELAAGTSSTVPEASERLGCCLTPRYVYSIRPSIPSELEKRSAENCMYAAEHSALCLYWILTRRNDVIRPCGGGHGTQRYNK
ncbi:hypothetical protein NPIL_149571 [Nephila pilipes]|uniref:Uncharacterized protein n=1 Tax=Nephila pilipes TaxID=299642 RepID=A0A8X6NBA1_NEPPI|nr:hypothetical protein NPIL_149571 [Nephila pilipes]